jgi:rSAM/selenodomain-associated transferase 2
LDALGRLLAGLTPDPRLEIVVADGAADSRLDRVAAARHDVRVVRSRPGRAAQMNAGAAVSTAPWLVFVHADSRMPAGWLDHLESCPPDLAGGWFLFALDDAAWQARVVERGVRWRVRLLRLPYGDQGLFARRDVFARMGGYRDLPLMEDVDFLGRLRREGRCLEIPLPLVTSARRWRRDGWLRRSTQNLALVTLYFAGVSPATLARWYYGRRP